MFASELFDANYNLPDIFIFPDHHSILKKYLEGDPEAQIMGNPGTTEALLVMTMWLNDQKRLIGGSATTRDKSVDFMSFHHLLTLISLFHPSIRVRNAATVLAGLILSADGSEDDRLSILEDLLENCMFSSLKACAVTWLREEIVAARLSKSKGRFSSPECLDVLQYTLFQDLGYLRESEPQALLEFWAQNSPFHFQVANFALFLFGNDYKDFAPVGMAAAIEHRYVSPLLAAAKTLKGAIEKKEVSGDDMEPGVLMDLEIFMDTLQRIPLQ